MIPQVLLNYYYIIELSRRAPMGRIRNWCQIQELKFKSFIFGKFLFWVEMISQFVSETSTRIVYFICKIMQETGTPNLWTLPSLLWTLKLLNLNRTPKGCPKFFKETNFPYLNNDVSHFKIQLENDYFN